jgi:hypothetical protein
MFDRLVIDGVTLDVPSPSVKFFGPLLITRTADTLHVHHAGLPGHAAVEVAVPGLRMEDGQGRLDPGRSLYFGPPTPIGTEDSP